jgi:hypothetical protein
LEWIILLMAVAALVLDPLDSPARLRLRRDKTMTVPAAGAFHEGGIDPTTDMAEMPQQFEFLGSWTPTGPFHGEYRTIWFRAERHLDVLLAGRPQAAGAAVQVEVVLRSGAQQTIAYSGPSPGLKWRPWRVTLPPDAVRLRIFARNDRTTSDGWFAFSAPMQVTFINWGLLLPLLKLTSTFVLAWVLICGPGLAWMSWTGRPSADLVLAIFPGPVSLSVLGTIIWAAGSWIPGELLARCGVGSILAALCWARLHSPSGWFRREWLTVLAGSALIAGFAVAKANVSLGPPGELFGGSISRTLEVGGHSDSRISYAVTQVAVRHLGPFSKDSKNYFAPYSFGSRGPLAGWLATPLVLGTGGRVPADMPNQPWRPFDPEGFATYRIALIVLASLSAWALWGVACGLGGLPVAQLAVVLLLLAPFFTHELYFTWPKLMSAAGVLASWHCIRQKRSFCAGLALGLGYLFHPGALLSAPFLAFWTMGDTSLGSVAARWRQAVRLVLGTFSAVLPWYILGRWDPGAVSQDTFLGYFWVADAIPATGPTWWMSRWDTFANTFIPGYVVWFHSAHPSYNSIFGPSGGWVHFSLMYWSTFPFAVGLPLFVVMLVALRRGIARHPLAAALTILVPALWIIVYWGGASTGFMRQCGQVFFLSSLLFCAWSLVGPSAGPADGWSRVNFFPWFIALRCADLLLMAFGSALQSGWQGDSVRYLSNDLCSLCAALGCLLGTAVLAARARLHS